MVPSAKPSSGKRRYSRPTPEVWAEATNLFLSGAATLAELATRFGVSTRAIQIHAARRRAASSKAAPPPATFTGIAATASALHKATHAECIEETKASAYANAVTLQTVIGQALAALGGDTSIPPTARLRACDQAAVALERTHKIRRTVLGMSREDDVADRPLPELPIRVLTNREVEAIRATQVAEDQCSESDLSIDQFDPADDGVTDEE